jgi:PAS domain S-box-containing protein
LEVFEAYAGMYRYQHLPGFAQFILDHHLTEFVREQIDLSFRLNIPLLTSLLQRFSKEDLIEISKKTSTEYLSYLKENRAYDQIKDSSEKWINDQLNVIGKFQITGPDITLINYIRQQAFRKLIPEYAKDVSQALQLSTEVDTLMLGANTTAINIYVNILKDKIEEESLLSNKLIAASPAITFLFDIVHNKEIFVSGKVQEVMGYTPAELVAMGSDVLLQLTHPDDLALVARSIEELVTANSESVGQIEYRFLHKSGNYRWLRTYYVIFKRDELGLPVELLGKTFEITREKETALALEKREQQLLEAQALAHIGSYEWNIKENRSVNTPEVYKIFEMDDDQRYEEFMSYVHPDDVQKVKDAITKSFATGSYDCEYRYIKNEKEKVIWSLGKVQFENNQPARMIGTVQDITEIKAIEKELLEKTKQLEESNKSLQQFASVASHDLKEPLRKISMFADLVMEAEKESISQASMDRLMRMQASSKSMMQMIQDILAFSMLEVKQQKEKVSLDILLKQILDLLDERIREKKAEIVFERLPEVYVIPSQFRQILQNLVSNALKFSNKDVAPKIQIHYKWLTHPIENLKPASKYLQLTICDNGIGIEKEYLESIFDLFKRLHPKAEYEGSGLGLAITKRIVDNHEGTISVSSTLNEGSCFRITIPQ